MLKEIELTAITALCDVNIGCKSTAIRTGDLPYTSIVYWG
jgi:hypothetical protein